MEKKERAMMAIQLFEHNQKAYMSALSMLKETGKAAIIHPTGTGKSFIGFKLAEDNPDSHILWLTPSEYIVKTQLENLKNECGAELDNITFITYPRLMLMTAEEINLLHPDCIIADEYHRMGARMWAEGAERLRKAYPDTPMLGLSATNIRYLDNQRDMAQELFDGNIASEMTLGEAIARGILNPPVYITALYAYEEELKKYEHKIKHARYQSVRTKAQEIIDRLRRALEMADGLDIIFAKHMKDKTGKYIVFCESYKHMTDMLENTRKWFGKVDKSPHIYSVYSDNPETSTEFAEFKKDDSNNLKLLFCIDMLNEGIHVEDVAGVILLRPTISPIVYKQQIGRALSASGTKEPVIFDIVNNFENLYSVSTIQDEINAAITYYRYLGENERIVNERFELIDEVQNCRRLFEELEDTLSASWEEMYSKAKAYYKLYGNLDVPRRYKTEDGYSLGNWLSTQRKVRLGQQYGRLSEAQIKRLDEIGMRWESAKDVSWNKYFNEAKAYYEKYGNLKVPVQYVTPTGIHLGCWINNLRVYKRNGVQSNYLNDERIAALETIGMVWDVVDYLWERNYMAAMEFYKEHGHLDIPCSYISKDGLKIGMWIRNIRGARKGQYSGNPPTEEQIRRLDEIGMLWDDKFARQWEKGYAEAKIYYESHGNLNVANGYVAPSGYKLGAWISNQREAQKRMKPERKAKLNEIGMIWKKPNSWEVRYALAKAYYDEYGNLKMPGDYKANGIWVAKWLNEQKQIYRGNRKGKRLTKEQINRLEAIGIDWGAGKEPHRIMDENKRRTIPEISTEEMRQSKVG